MRISDWSSDVCSSDLRHAGQAWEGRLDGQPVASLGDLCAALAAVSFEPGSHALVSGGGEPRRRYVDWGLFHVEPDFLPLWRRYARALKQRNRSEEHTSELQSLMRISYAVFCLK